MKDKKHKKIFFGLIIIFLVAFLVGISWIWLSLNNTFNNLSKSEKYPEVVYKEMISPYKNFKIIITHYETSLVVPGVKGFIYISDLDGIKKKKVIDFGEDFIDDIISHIVWDESKKGFYYADKIINLTEYPLK